MLEKDLQSAKKEAEKANQEAEKAKSELDQVKGDLAQSQFLVESLDEELVKLNNQFKRFKEEAKQVWRSDLILALNLNSILSWS